MSTSQVRSTAILTDSLSALAAIARNCWKSHGIVAKIVILNHRLLTSGHNIVYVWLPAHTGIPGNNTADFLVKLSTTHNPIQPDVTYKKVFSQISYSESSSLVTDHCLQLWNDFCINTNKAITYKQFYPSIANGPIQPTHSSMLFRLRAGHCRQHYHLHRIGLHPNGLCDECNSAETVEHFLMYCEQCTSHFSTNQATTIHAETEDQIPLDANFTSMTKPTRVLSHTSTKLAENYYKPPRNQTWHYKTMQLKVPHHHNKHKKHSVLASFFEGCCLFLVCLKLSNFVCFIFKD